MMTIFIVFIIVSLGAIIFLSRQTFVESRTKDQFLKDLTRHVNGNLEPFEGQENSYKLSFHFEKYDFIFEDWELKGFQEKVDKAYLRLKLKNKYTLLFSEIDRSGGIRAEAQMLSKAKEEALTHMMKVSLPKQLSDLNVKTNDPYITNRLFDDSKILPIILQYRNVDTRGYSSMSIRIVDGIVTLEFSSVPGVNPSLTSLRSNMGAIENYIDQFIRIAKKMEAMGYA